MTTPKTTISPRRRIDLLPLLGFGGLLALWTILLRFAPHDLLPGPRQVLRGIVELAQKGLLAKYVVASLYRVTWGYLLAVVLAIPAGLALGWHRRVGMAVSPLLQIVRPISPLAWIPIAILWFGVGDAPAVFIIFVASFSPLAFTAMSAVRGVSEVHLRAGRNFGLSDAQILRRIVFPSVLPQLISGLRLSLGVAWLVVVAAEMIAVNSGLGFLIVDARNAGNRYDLVVAGMVLIGVIGLALDVVMRRLERLRGLRWSFAAGEGGDNG